MIFSAGASRVQGRADRPGNWNPRVVDPSHQDMEIDDPGLIG